MDPTTAGAIAYFATLVIGCLVLLYFKAPTYTKPILTGLGKALLLFAKGIWFVLKAIAKGIGGGHRNYQESQKREELAREMNQRNSSRTVITPQAIKLSEALRQRGIHNELEHSDGFKHVDIQIPWAKLNVEVDGKYHIASPEHLYRDLLRDAYSHRDGVWTIRIRNSDVDYNLDKVADNIAEVARKRQGSGIGG